MLEGQFSPALNLALFSRVLAEAQSDWPPQTLVTGFPFLETEEAERTKRLALSAFLDRGAPPVVFTFGSSAVRSARDLFAACVAAARMLGRRAVLLAGPDPATMIASAGQPDILAFGYLPHRLAFRQAAAVVHHGGIGTLAEAMRAGHPMVILPFAHDQPDNASRARRLGIAEVVPIGAREASPVPSTSCCTIQRSARGPPGSPTWSRAKPERAVLQKR